MRNPEPPRDSTPYVMIGAILISGLLIVAAVVASSWGWL
jgi:hypothetical protein